MRASLFGALGVLGALGLLTGCATGSAAGGGKNVCVDWPFFDSVDQASGSGQLVVRAELEPIDQTLEMYGEEASVHRATVTEVFAGDISVGAVLDVASTPASCTNGAPYPDGDPMVRDEATLILDPDSPADGEAGIFHTITPYAGVWDERPAAR